MSSPQTRTGHETRTRRPSFFVLMTAVLALAVLVGFARTFFLRPLFGLPDLPGYLVLHGLVLTAWFAFLAVQVWLARSGSTAIHRRIGPYRAFLAVAVIGTGAFTLALRDAPFVDESLSGSIGNLLSLVGFAFCVGVGILVRKRPEAHKRLMLLGSILIAAPAVDRAGRLPVLEGWIDPLLPDPLGSTGAAFVRLVS